MKKNLSVWCVFFMLNMPCVATANIILDPSFETPGTWVYSNAGCCSTASSLSGNTGTEWGILGGEGTLSQSLSPTLGSAISSLTIYATMWSGSPSHIDSPLEIILGYTSGTDTSGAQLVDTVDTWTFFDFTSIVDPTRTVNNITLHQIGSGFLAVDDVAMLTEGNVPAPATIALFGIGLAGLGWSRRKKS